VDRNCLSRDPSDRRKSDRPFNPAAAHLYSAGGDAVGYRDDPIRVRRRFGDLCRPIAVIMFIAIKKLYVREALGERTVLPGEDKAQT
jgi:hypothetical protein